MAAVEREVRKIVIKRIPVETDDVGVAPFVLGVAARTLGGRDGCKTAVKSFARL